MSDARRVGRALPTIDTGPVEHQSFTPSPPPSASAIAYGSWSPAVDRIERGNVEALPPPFPSPSNDSAGHQPDVTRILNAASEALRSADNDNARLLAVRDAAEALENIGASVNAIDDLRVLAATYGVLQADVENIIAQGIEMERVARTFGGPDVFNIEHQAPELEPEPAKHLEPKPKPQDINDILRQHGEDAVRAAFDRAEDSKTNSRDRKRGRPDSQPGAWRERLIKPRELFDRRFDELKYVVPGTIPEGVTLLASRPKLGKSWLLLQTCTAIATGVVTLVASNDPPCGDVLYLSLEDNPRRLKRRLGKYFGAQREAWPARLTLTVTWRRLDQGGLDDLREWCRSVAKPTLIAIDTLKKVRPPKRNGQSDYDADYEACEGLKKLVDEFPGLSIIVAHHDRTMAADDVFDTISGTLGLTGGVDTVALLKRSSRAITLHVEGRDLIEQIEKAVSFDRDTCRWCILGEAAEVQRSGERSRVLAALTDLPAGLTVSEIQAAAQLATQGATNMLLSRMVRDGEVVRIDRGRFSLPQYTREKREIDKEYGENPTKTHTPAHTPNSNASNAESQKHHTPAPPSYTSVLEFLTWALKPGRRLVRDIEASARAEGLLGERQRIDNAKTFQDAKSILKVVVEREGFGPGSKVYWRWPDADSRPDTDSRQDAQTDGGAAAQATPMREPEDGQ